MLAYCAVLLVRDLGSDKYTGQRHRVNNTERSVLIFEDDDAEEEKKKKKMRVGQEEERS